MPEKHVQMVVRNVELGWSGSRGGRTIEFEFFDGTRKLGTLQVGSAALRWNGRWARDWSRSVPVDELDDLFNPISE